MMVLCSDLPYFVRNVLKSFGCMKRDISCEAAETFSFYDAGSDGQRAYAVICDLASETVVKRFIGSWGGANMFVQNVVDGTDSRIRDAEFRVLENMLIITGSMGYRNYASLICHKDNVNRYIRQELVITDAEKLVLGIIKSHNTMGRRDEFEYQNLGVYGPDHEIIKSLAAKKLVTINKIGNIMLTLDGKNSL